jgi:hypothetical protein
MGAPYLPATLEPEDDDARPEATEAVPSGTRFAVVGHEALFAPEEGPEPCDVCGELVPEDSGEGHAVPGRALYVWARGDETRREEPPLCASCAAALGLTALARWEIEEEEG